MSGIRRGLFISRAGPGTIECLFRELGGQAFTMDIVDRDEAVKVSLDGTFMKAYSGRERREAKATGAQESAKQTAETTSYAGEPKRSLQCRLFS